MRTQFKNTDEYKDFSGILKRKSLNVKNRNISLTLKIKKIVEKFPIVEKIREIIIKNLPSCSLMKGKLIISSTDYVYQLCRNVVSKNEIDFHYDIVPGDFINWKRHQKKISIKTTEGNYQLLTMNTIVKDKIVVPHIYILLRTSS